MKNLYIKSCKNQIEKILTLQDRNQFSKTYGCFDRNYWHYKTRDFPSAMSQEFTLTLALVYSIDFPDNIFHNNKNIYKWILAGIENTILQSRFDGSLDDYYPYERALGASVFTSYALTESCILLGINNSIYNNYFVLANKWMNQSDESGLLVNHHAIQALCHLNLYRLTKNNDFLKLADKKIEKIITLQDKEGWFPEYDGCSPGYLTVTIDFLSQFFKNRPSSRLEKSILKAIDFFYYIQHPDGTCGGDYGSRNTFFFHPNGFEIMSEYSQQSLEIANSYLVAKEKNIYPIQEDDYTIGHGLISNLNAYKNCERGDFAKLNNKGNKTGKIFTSAGIKIMSTSGIWSIFNYKKGGVGKIYIGDKLTFNYSGVIIKNKNNYYINNSKQLNGKFEFDNNQIKIFNRFSRYHQKLPSLYNYFLFRFFLILFGRFESVSMFVRKILQNLLIYKKNKSNYFSETKISLIEDSLSIKIIVYGKLSGFEEVYISENFVPIYTAMSEYFSINDLNTINKKLHKKENKFIFEISYKI